MKPPRHSEAQLHRDAALMRIVRTRRFVIAASAALTAGFAAVVSSVAPGHTLRKSDRPLTTASTSNPVAASTQMPPLASPGDLGLQGTTSVPQSSQISPSQAAPVTPDPTQQVSPVPAPVVSGGS